MITGMGGRRFAPPGERLQFRPVMPRESGVSTSRPAQTSQRWTHHLQTCRS